MKNVWIKLLKKYEVHEVGAVIEVAEAVAKALTNPAVGIAEDAQAPAEQTLTAVAKAQLDTAVAGVVNEVKAVLDGAATSLKAGRPNLHVVAGESEDEKKLPTGGFKSVGHFAHTLVRGTNPSSPDAGAALVLKDYHDLVGRVVKTPTGMNEGSDPEGGSLVPVTYSDAIWERARDNPSLSDDVDFMPIAGTTMSMPADSETSRADGKRRGGIAGYWEGEADQIPKSRPTFDKRELKLKKCTVMVYATDELISDSAGALDSYLMRVGPEELAFKVNDGLANGKGAGLLQGFLNSPAKVTVAKEAGQGAATIVAANILKMWGQAYAPCRKDMKWYCNQDAEQQLYQLFLGTGTSSGTLTFTPAGGLSGVPYATLMGRPIVPIEQAQTLGVEGDLSLVAMNQYLGIKKAAGVQAATSIHLRFDFNETVFRFLLRMDAMSAWSAPLTPKNSTKQQSHIVTLQGR